MLDPRRLALLREVVRHGSFSKAAEALFLTQPAVSRQVAKLEREVGVRLLERTPGGLRLTDAGKISVAPYDTGYKTGVKIRLEDFRHQGLLNQGRELDLALVLTVCLEGKDEELVCDAAAIAS